MREDLPNKISANEADNKMTATPADSVLARDEQPQ